MYLLVYILASITSKNDVITSLTIECPFDEHRDKEIFVITIIQKYYINFAYLFMYVSSYILVLIFLLVITSFLEIKLAKIYTHTSTSKSKQANIKSRPGCAVKS